MKMTNKECNDAGLALVFIALLTALIGKYSWALPLAVGLTLLLMISPRPFALWARGWFGLSHVMGTIVSKVLLTLVFFTIVLPIALVRRMMGKDTMRLGLWKNGDGSVFRVRGGRVTASDLEQMF